MECSRMEVELEAANEKISVLMDMSRAALGNREMNNAQVAVVDDGIDEGSLRAELRGFARPSAIRSRSCARRIGS